MTTKHCKAVTFEVDIDATKGNRCNCSVCTKLGNGRRHREARRARRAWRGEPLDLSLGRHDRDALLLQALRRDVLPAGYLDVLGGDYVSISFNALDDVDPNEVAVVYWDGRHDNWMAGPRATPWPIFTDERTRSRLAAR